MKNVFIWLPLAFVLGGIVGAWGPGEELKALKKREAERPAEVKKSAPAGFGSFAQLVNIPETARRPRRVRVEEVKTSGEGSDTNAAPAAAESAAKAPERPRRLAPTDLRARIDEAADLWRTRAEIAKTKTIEKLWLDASGADSFNAAVDEMNARLRESIQIIADELANAREMTPELGVRLMGDLSTTLAETYDLIGESAGADRRDEVSSLMLTDFIDPSVAEPLIDVQDKLGGPGFDGDEYEEEGPDPE